MSKNRVTKAIEDAKTSLNEAALAASALPEEDSKAAQMEAENESHIDSVDPNAPNRLKPDPGSTTRKPTPPEQRKVAPKIAP
jgi:hypothetical protein|mmetsp:Transcript_13236/g.18002  ORF Transcript_13236/g.18002 Transcript_13236/m.18002 type:complete len:82 (-) Transcript_13236:564-809(-)